MIKNKFQKLMLIGLAMLFLGAGGFFAVRSAKAETVGSLNSGVTSRIKTLYTALTSASYGSDAAGAWGDWGAYWNRIYAAATWAPTGNAAVTDVKSGKTFFNSTRTVATGTYPNPTSCSTEAYHDSYGAGATETTNCVVSMPWTANPAPATGDDACATGICNGRGGYDPRTGLTWSQLIYNNSGTPAFSLTTNSAYTWDGSTTFTITAGSATAGATYTNNGNTFTVVTTIASGTSLNTTGTGLPAASGTLTYVAGGGANTSNLTFSTYTGTNAAVANKTAKQLCMAMGGSWRLPTQKELMQAYIDGSYFNLTQPSNFFWSATEYSATTAWLVTLLNGTTSTNTKTTGNYQVRCVR